MCISRFSNRGIGGKDPPKRADELCGDAIHKKEALSAEQSLLLVTKKNTGLYGQSLFLRAVIQARDLLAGLNKEEAHLDGLVVRITLGHDKLLSAARAASF